MKLTKPTKRIANQRGTLTLVELLVASVILIIIMWGIANYYYRGRSQVDFEEVHRKGTAAAQLRLDQLRAYRYGALPSYDGTDTTIVMDGRTYKVAMAVTPATPNLNSTTMTADVSWALGVNPGAAGDTLHMAVTTIVGRIVR